MSAFSGMLSFEVKGGREPAMNAVAKLKIFIRATSLGGVESLVEHRALRLLAKALTRHKDCCALRSASNIPMI